MACFFLVFLARPAYDGAMEPYYQDDAVTIYHGNNLEILPALEFNKTAAVVTDPPYGIDYGKAGGFSAPHGWGPWRENVSWDAKRPDRAIFDLMRERSGAQVIWGGNYFTDYLPPSMGWLIGIKVSGSFRSLIAKWLGLRSKERRAFSTIREARRCWTVNSIQLKNRLL